MREAGSLVSVAFSVCSFYSSNLGVMIVGNKLISIASNDMSKKGINREGPARPGNLQ